MGWTASARRRSRPLAAIRAIRPSDGQGLLAVWRDTWPATYGPTLGDAAVEVMTRALDGGIETLLPRDASAGFCATDGDRIVATAIHSLGRPVVHLWGFYVLPSHQREGLGRGLLAAVHEVAGNRPIECRVLEGSRGAVGFYEAQGFRVVGREPTAIMPGVEPSCLVMRRTA